MFWHGIRGELTSVAWWLERHLWRGSTWDDTRKLFKLQQHPHVHNFQQISRLLLLGTFCLWRFLLEPPYSATPPSPRVSFFILTCSYCTLMLNFNTTCPSNTWVWHLLLWARGTLCKPLSLHLPHGADVVWSASISPTIFFKSREQFTLVGPDSRLAYDM